MNVIRDSIIALVIVLVVVLVSAFVLDEPLGANQVRTACHNSITSQECKSKENEYNLKFLCEDISNGAHCWVEAR